MAGTTSGVKFTANGDDTDIKLYQGKTILFELIWGGDAPIDVTGFDARMQLRKSTTYSDFEAEFTVANSRVAIGTTDGKITFSMTATDSALLDVSAGVYDIEVIDDSNNVFLAMSGQYEIIGEVTR